MFAMVEHVTQPKVAIIVLNWRRPSDTLACLESLAQIVYPNAQIIVVDNASGDDSVPLIRGRFPDATVIENSDNLGYAEGNNVGIRYALQHRPDYVCVLNNDTLVAPDFLGALVSEAERDPDIGMVGPKMYFFEPPDMIYAAGSMVDWQNGILIHRGIWQHETPGQQIYSEKSETVDFIVGCGVLIRRQVIDQIGMLDSRYYLNFEDVDWCLRARQAGFQVRYTPKAILWHRVSASLGQNSARNTYYTTRNSLLLFHTYLRGWQRWQVLSRIVLRNLGHILAWTLKSEYRKTAKAKRDANLRALRDAFLGRFGKMGPDVDRICS